MITTFKRRLGVTPAGLRDREQSAVVRSTSSADGEK
jgi:hypothetical protein